MIEGQLRGLSQPSRAGTVPPQANEAERSVLGAMLLDGEAVAKALEILEASAFYRLAHRQIFQAIVNLWDQGEAVDLITVGDELRRQGNFDSAGGATALAGLFDAVATSGNVQGHARVVLEKSVLRNIISTCTQITARAYEDTEHSDSLLDEAESAIFGISDKRLKRGFVRAKEMVNPTIKIIEKLYAEKKLVTGVPSGFKDLDRLTSGFQAGDLVIIAGRPSMGKTSLALNMASHVALRENKTVGLFSLEMSSEQLLIRLLCSEGRVASERVRTGYLRDQEWPLLITAASHLSEAPLYIDDSAAMTVLELRAKARRLQSEADLSLLIVDYLQLLRSSGRFESRQQEITEISRSLKALAKELHVPIVVLSQLSRAVDSRPDHRPVLSDLRESGAIEQDADVVAFVFREEHYEQTEQNEGLGEIIVGKQRNGPVGSVKVSFIGEYTRFESMAREQEQVF